MPILILWSYEVNYSTRLFRNRISPALAADLPSRTETILDRRPGGKKIRLKNNKPAFSAAPHRAIPKSTNEIHWPLIFANALSEQFWRDVRLEPLSGSRFGHIRVREGKSKNAGRTIPLTDRGAALTVTA